MKSSSVQHAADAMQKHRQQFDELCRSLTQEELDRPVPDSSSTKRSPAGWKR
jgi:hypothetical protein